MQCRCPDLEDQLCGWVPDTGEASPDRLDALVWALTALSQERKRYSFTSNDCDIVLPCRSYKT